MMSILTREYTKQIAVLDKEISILELVLVPFKDHALYSKLQIKLKEHLLVFNKNILQKIETKFWRDKTAFSEGRAYKWVSNSTFLKKQSRDYPPLNKCNANVQSNSSL